MKKTFIGLAGALSLLATSAFAAEEHRQLGAHEHGHGRLNIAIDGETLAIELLAPGMDIVGFEHAPGNDEQHGKVNEATVLLKTQPLQLFGIPAAAGCKLVSAEVEIAGGQEEHEAHADKAERHEEEGEHNEFHATYELTCTAPAALTSMDFGFFVAFPGAGELDVTILDEKGQASYEVSRGAPKLQRANR